MIFLFDNYSWTFFALRKNFYSPRFVRWKWCINSTDCWVILSTYRDMSFSNESQQNFKLNEQELDSKMHDGSMSWANVYVDQFITILETYIHIFQVLGLTQIIFETQYLNFVADHTTEQKLSRSLSVNNDTVSLAATYVIITSPPQE